MLQQLVGNAKGWLVEAAETILLNLGLANSIASLRVTVLSMDFAMTAIVKMKEYSSIDALGVIALPMHSAFLVIAIIITALCHKQIKAYAPKTRLKDVEGALAQNVPRENSASTTGACLTQSTRWPQKLAQTVSASTTDIV